MLRLRELREEKHISQQRLAMELYVTQACISKYELGKSDPDIRTLKKFAQYFKVSIDYLVGYSKQRVPLAEPLSAEEQTLLARYRTLDPLQKAKLEGFLIGVSESF